MAPRPGPWASITDLVDAVRQRRPRAIARAITLVENDAAALPELAAALAPDTGRAHVLGLTGPPGVGKSTIVTALVGELRHRGLRVGVLAVDPSSPFTGGALLGDRVRMQEHAEDPDVVIRSMASRGHLGGLAAAAPQALRVFDAAGCDLVCLETVGVGQSEVEVAGACDTTCVLSAPGAGDQIQAAKAGLLEIGDVFVVNKAERDGAQAVVRELRTMIALAQRDPDDWKPPIVRATATTGEGVAELVDRVLEHRSHAERTGAWRHRRVARARAEVQALVVAAVRRRYGDVAQPDALTELAVRVAEGRLDAHRAAVQLLDHSVGGPGESVRDLG